MNLIFKTTQGKYLLYLRLFKLLFLPASNGSSVAKTFSPNEA